MLILAPANSSLATMDGKTSQRELHEKVIGSKPVVIDGAGHEIYLYRQSRGLPESVSRILR